VAATRANDLAAREAKLVAETQLANRAGKVNFFHVTSPRQGAHFYLKETAAMVVLAQHRRVSSSQSGKQLTQFSLDILPRAEGFGNFLAQ
jgi:hypothetical protein